ncbi:MAG: LysM peptidoglycan-binding domain-containing protein [Acetatifactor sp.]|nr:LysM peptidoglycan-binding domain-containing protein [Acetatifactor sp.]
MEMAAPEVTEASEAEIATPKITEASEEQNAGKNTQDAQTATAAGEAPEKEDDKKKPATYVVQAGDTLTGISIRNYGSEKYIGQICKLNSIKNPDEIKVGQKILLP